MRKTSTDYARPHRPLPIRGLNGLLGVLGPLRASLDADNLVNTARRAEGLHDLGPPDVSEPLTRLTEALEHEAELHGVGRWLTRTRLLTALRSRLRLQAWLAAEPSRLHRPMRPPVVVVGMQRTGTTLLHRLLSASPSFRGMRAYEALNPTLHLGQDADPRPTAALRASRALRYLAPDFFAVHPVDPDGFEEEVVLMDYAFLSTVPEATYHVPSYSRWVEEQDNTPAYELLRRMLLMLGDGSHPRWVLKTPHHLEWLDTLVKVFPDALFVHTHRDPAQALPSFCSMVAHARGVFSNRVDPQVVGRQWGDKVQRMLARSMQARERIGERRFLDVSYEQLMRDPMGVVADVHAHTGEVFDGHVATPVKQALAESPRHRFGEHVYQAADFGLDDGRLDAIFGPYRARYADWIAHPPPGLK